MTDEAAQTVDFEGAEASTTSIAMEAVTELFHRLPWGMEIVLSNGRTATLKKFVEPRLNDDGKEEFGFDLWGEDACFHLEFMVTRTGWGMAIEQSE